MPAEEAAAKSIVDIYNRGFAVAGIAGARGLRSGPGNRRRNALKKMNPATGNGATARKPEPTTSGTWARG